MNYNNVLKTKEIRENLPAYFKLKLIFSIGRGEVLPVQQKKKIKTVFFRIQKEIQCVQNLKYLPKPLGV